MLDVKNVSMSCPLCPQRTKQNYLLHNPLSNYYTTLSPPDRKLRSSDQGHLVQHTATYNIIKHHQTSLACLEECQRAVLSGEIVQITALSPATSPHNVYT